MREEFSSGLYIAEAEDFVKCPYCKEGFAKFYLRRGGSAYFQCENCAEDLPNDIANRCITYYEKMKFSQEEAEEMFSVLYEIALSYKPYKHSEEQPQEQRAKNIIEKIREAHRKVLREESK